MRRRPGVALGRRAVVVLHLLDGQDVGAAQVARDDPREPGELAPRVGRAEVLDVHRGDRQLGAAGALRPLPPQTPVDPPRRRGDEVLVAAEGVADDRAHRAGQPVADVRGGCAGELVVEDQPLRVEVAPPHEDAAAPRARAARAAGQHRQLAEARSAAPRPAGARSRRACPRGSRGSRARPRAGRSARRRPRRRRGRRPRSRAAAAAGRPRRCGSRARSRIRRRGSPTWR